MTEDVIPYGGAPTPDELRALISQLGMTQRAAARALDVEDRTLRYWASGQVPIPRMAILALRYLVADELARVNRLVDLQTDRKPATVMLDDPRATALRDWLIENDKRAARGLTPVQLAAYLAEAEDGQGQIEVPALHSVSGVPITYHLEWGK
jgi:transcriptional regulator with XRE-family HTH domain